MTRPADTGAHAPAHHALPAAPVTQSRAASIAFGGSVVLGAAAGIVWGLIAPGQHLYVADADRVLSLDQESNNVFVAVALFVLVTALAGVLSGVAAWAWRSVRGPAMGLAIMAGGLAGAWLAAILGDAVASARLGWPGADAAAQLVGQVIVQPPTVSLWVALIGQALGAGLVYLFAAGLTAEDGLGVAEPGRVLTPGA